jgi:serine protease Do
MYRDRRIQDVEAAHTTPHVPAMKSESFDVKQQARIRQECPTLLTAAPDVKGIAVFYDSFAVGHMVRLLASCLFLYILFTGIALFGQQTTTELPDPDAALSSVESQSVRFAELLSANGFLTAAERASLQMELERSALVLDAQARAVRMISLLVGPAAVHIEAKSTRAAPGQAGYSQRVEEAGAGVIVLINEKNYVLTSAHVIQNAMLRDIRITRIDGTITTPVQAWSDPDTDIAVLAVNMPDAVAAPIGNSQDLGVGDFVVVIGSPFGLDHSVTTGIVSALGRRNLELAGKNLTWQDFIQTDAAINPGNSGGPLIDSHGRVIGVVAAIASNSGGNEGVGFAVPINIFMKVATELISHGSVSKAFLGVTLDADYDAVRARASGLPTKIGSRVMQVTPNTPAAAAEIMPGDIILEINNIPIQGDDHLLNVVQMQPIGELIPMLVYRDQEAIEVQATLISRADP